MAKIIPFENTAHMKQFLADLVADPEPRGWIKFKDGCRIKWFPKQSVLYVANEIAGKKLPHVFEYEAKIIAKYVQGFIGDIESKTSPLKQRLGKELKFAAQERGGPHWLYITAYGTVAISLLDEEERREQREKDYDKAEAV